MVQKNIVTAEHFQDSMYVDSTDNRKYDLQYKFFVKDSALVKKEKTVIKDIQKHLEKQGYKVQKHHKKGLLMSYSARSVKEFFNDNKLQNTIYIETKKVDNDVISVECEMRVSVGYKIMLPAEQALWKSRLEEIQSVVTKKEAPARAKDNYDHTLNRRVKMTIGAYQILSFALLLGLTHFGIYIEKMLSNFFFEKQGLPNYMFQNFSYFDSMVTKFLFTAGMLMAISILFDMNIKRREKAENKYLRNPSALSIGNIIGFFLQDILKKTFLALGLVIFAIPVYFTLDEVVKAMLAI